MRPWRFRLALRRSRIQWALLTVVLLVSTISAALVGSLFLLTSATETRAAREALTNAAPTDIAVTTLVYPSDTGATVDRLRQAAQNLWQELPHETRVMITGNLIQIPREDSTNVLTYFSVIENIDDIAVLRDGQWPTDAVGEVIPVAIPTSVAGAFSLSVGDTVDVRPTFGRDRTTLSVTGVFVPGTAPDIAWNLDRLGARGYQERVVVPGTGGRIVQEGFGPIIVTEATYLGLDSRLGRTATAGLTATPDLAEVSYEQSADLLTQRATLETTTQQTLGGSGSDVRVITSIDTTVGTVIGSLAVTRSSVVVMGLLLLVLSVAALAQTARLMAERRHQELQLMVARGASSRQVLRLGFIEAFGLGLVTVVAGAWGARYGYQALTSIDVMKDAGLHHDPGIPVGVWIVTGVVGILLIAVAVGPLLKRQGSFVEAQQANARPSKRSVLQRSGLDIGLVVLAAVAYWQLRSYESPVIAEGGLVRLDPMLAAGPALALLAGSLLAVRLIPAASRFMEAIASRGRRAVMPLAAWEVGRRSGRAVSAILLLTLAMSVGTFAMAYLSTWQRSQSDQALYQHPQDVRVTAVERADLITPGVLGDDAALAPVVEGRMIVNTDMDTPVVSLDSLAGREIRMVASSADGFSSYDQERLGRDFGSTVPAALSLEPIWDGAMPIAEGAHGIQAEVSAWSAATSLNQVNVSLRAVIRDAYGALTTLDLGTIAVPEASVDTDPEAFTVMGRLPQANTAALGYSVVGFQTVWSSQDEDVDPGELSREGLLEMTLVIADLSSYRVTQYIPVVGQDPLTATEPIALVERSAWTTTASRAALPQQETEAGTLRIGALAQPNPLRMRPSTVTYTLTEQRGAVPVVLTATAAHAVRVEAGEPMRISVDGSIIEAVVAAVIPVLPDSYPHQAAGLVNLHHLNTELINQGSFPLAADRWWITGVDDVDALSAALPPDAVTTSLIAVTSDLANNPLRVATQAAIWLVVGAAVVLAAVGFAVHAIVTVRARETEFAQLRAVGVRRAQLLRVVAGESVLLSMLGVVFGVGIGLALGYLVSPLVTVGADGRAPLPEVLVDIPWSAIGLLAIEIVAVLFVTVVLVSILLRRINPAIVLRMGD